VLDFNARKPGGIMARKPGWNGSGFPRCDLMNYYERTFSGLAIAAAIRLWFMKLKEWKIMAWKRISHPSNFPLIPISL
jgi:hypothetical protein